MSKAIKNAERQLAEAFDAHEKAVNSTDPYSRDGEQLRAEAWRAVMDAASHKAKVAR